MAPAGAAVEGRTGPPAKAAAAVIDGLAAATPAFGAVVGVQEACLRLAREGLSLEAVPPPEGAGAAAERTGAAANGALHIVSADGASSTTASGFRGRHVRWLSTSTVASTTAAFGATRLLGFAGSSAAPHLSLGQKVEGGQVQVTAALLPRRTLLLDRPYFKRFFATAPGNGLPSYHALFASCLKREGWQFYVSPSPEARLLSEGAISFTFAPTEENLAFWSEAAHDLTRLWVALVEAGAAPSLDDDSGDTARYDACYTAELNDVVMMIALWLFDREAGAALQAAMTGSPVE